MSNMTQELEEHKSLLIALIAGLVVAALGIVVVQGRTQRPPVAPATNIPQNSAGAKDKESPMGKLSLISASGRQIFEPKETITLVIAGDSAGQPAVGFDAALQIDRTILAFSQVSPKIPSFETFDNVNDTRVYVGGIKKVAPQDAVIFNDTPLAEI